MQIYADTMHTTYTTYTALTVAHAPYSKFYIWGWGGLGGWVLLGPMGLVVPQRAPTGVRPSKEACDGAFESDNRTTSPRFQ